MTASGEPAPATLRGRATFAICAALLVVFGLISFTATLHKSATYDEVVHVAGGFMHKYFNDYRINPEDPALFGAWSALPHRDSVLMVDVRSESFQITKEKHDYQWVFAFSALYRSKYNDPDAIFRMSRSMFTYVGIALGALAAWWSWRLAGGVAAIVATVLFALDPNFAAHASLVKNDVALGLLLLALGYVTWTFGNDGKLWRLLLLASICGMAVNVKFSGVLFAPIAFALLVARAIIARPWRLTWINLTTIPQRLLGVFGVMIVIAIITVGITWATYGFRYASLRDGGLIDNEPLVTLTRLREVTASLDRPPTQDDLDRHTRMGFVPRLAFAINKWHLLPHAWTWGFVFTYATTLVRSSFLLGETSNATGFWYYFPLAILFKTPLATLTAIALATIFATVRFIFPKLEAAPDTHTPTEPHRHDLWTVLCLLVPPGVYLLVAMAGNLNLGLRHVLPIYAYLFIGVALVSARLIRQYPKWTKIAGAVLVIGLAAESLPTYPNYLPFFNTAAGGARGGIRLLADSNLDWGQDLMLVADWAKQHTDRPLLFSYFGAADPAYYGIQYVNLTTGGSLTLLMNPQRLADHHERAYVAISATSLQNVYAEVPEYIDLRRQKPIAVLGGSIYIYDWPSQNDRGGATLVK